MARVGILHPDLTTLGGGEVVSINILKALERTHVVDLVTGTPNVGLDSLAEFAGVETPEVTVNTASQLVELLHEARGNRFGLFEAAVFNRMVRSLREEYDVLFSTTNELTIPGPAVQYVHYPQFDRSNVPGEAHTESLTYEFYKRLCRQVAGWNPQTIADSTLLANSKWTASVTEDIYGVRPLVVHPPIDVDEFSPIPWAEREPGFVSVGRLEPHKNVLKMIEIVDGLRSRGHDTHLHVVGAHNDDEYGDRVVAAVADRSHVSYEGSLERDQLIDLLTTHQYGLHGRRYEHFGVVVAEMVAAGMVPLVPNSGGQVEIVSSNDAVTYDSRSDAIEKADRLLSGAVDHESVRRSFVDPSEFSVERFRKSITDVVDDAADRVN